MIVGSGSGIKAGDVLEGLGKHLDSDIKRREFFGELAGKHDQIQGEINKIEAGHRTIFVAGWRPFVGWVCGAGLAWHAIVHDLFAWICVIFLPSVTPPELVGTEQLTVILGSLLGFGTWRTVEKLFGKAK